VITGEWEYQLCSTVIKTAVSVSQKNQCKVVKYFLIVHASDVKCSSFVNSKVWYLSLIFTQSSKICG